MSLSRRSGGKIIFVSIVAALMLTIMPLPIWTQYFRPEVIAMVLIYWCIAVPERVGVGIAWCAGLMLDVVKGSLLGQHALALAIIAWITLKLHQRIRVFPRWQQALSIFLLLSIYQLLIFWIKNFTENVPHSWTYWLPPITSALLWPWLFLIMRSLRRSYKVS